jgi:hypothetical protein
MSAHGQRMRHRLRDGADGAEAQLDRRPVRDQPKKCSAITRSIGPADRAGNSTGCAEAGARISITPGSITASP